jgi:hypothetical protein
MRKMFFKTEFDQSTEAKILAIGLISEDGSIPLYLQVFDDQSRTGGSDTRARSGAQVVPLYGRVQGAHMANLAALGRRLGNFIEELGEPVALCYEDAADWQLLESALMAGGCWKKVAPVLHARNVSIEICDNTEVQSHPDVSPKLALDRAVALRSRWVSRPSTDKTPFGVLRSFLGYHGLDSHRKTHFALLSQSDEWMAQHTTFIQWMLPVAELSMFRQEAPLLTLSDFERLSLDHRVRSGVVLSRDRVLQYLGLEYCEGQLSTRANWPEASEWSRISCADDLRVSRMLRSLVLFGFAEDARALYRGLEAIVRDARGIDIAEVTLAYWRAASFKDNGRP